MKYLKKGNKIHKINNDKNLTQGKHVRQRKEHIKQKGKRKNRE